MKVRIEISENLNGDEVIIRCSKLDERAQKIYDTVMDIAKGSKHLMLYKGNVEYYISLETILFFETSDNCISAHTVNSVYETTYRLYELEELLPGSFMRVSKSTIINLSHIYSISRNLTSSNEIQFLNTHKQVFVSRHYYKSLKLRLEEMRNHI
ncbi:MAG: response regulator of the LytR/AlgR family [Herbinix sp.]|jgi:DNA-binding LytR/AlgR family response regulator|nr:response regulator of the LytR/AlgR family [Herbinix sp.]